MTENKTGGVIYAYRKLKGLTQEQLAEVVGVSPVAVSKWERRISIPDIEILCRLADYFKISVDELLGRKIRSVEQNEKYSEELLKKFALGEELLTCSKVSRTKGLLAMEQIVGEGNHDNEFLRFAICFLLEKLQEGMQMEQITQLLLNYSQNEAESNHAGMITDVLFHIVSGESEEIIREVIASHLGAAYRGKFVHAAENAKALRNELLESYNNISLRYPDTHLLDELAECSDYEIQFILKSLENQTLVSALNGASGKVAKKFLENLAGRVLYFIDEDIKQYQGTEADILDAQKKILEEAVNLGIIRL